MRLIRRWMLMMVAAVVIVSAVSAEKYVDAKSYSENGTWKRTIDGTTWYFDINDYTSGERKELGVIYIYKGKKAFENHIRSASGEYVKIESNKYKLKYKGGKIVFQVYAKKIKLAQKKGKIDGQKLEGKFKLVKRHYS